MSIRNTSLRLLICTLASGASAHAFAQDALVAPAEIQQTWIGKDIIANTAPGARIWLRLESDGKASVSVGSTNDTGTWRLSDNGYCATWSVIRAGTERCFTVIRSGSTMKVINPDGSLSAFVNSIK